MSVCSLVLSNYTALLETRGNGQDYLALNDGYDTEALTEDRISSKIPDAAVPHVSAGS
ncbi:hypothetical protein V1508DRAFT_424700 [Lipomyces doorenjongii]|uniref:uncharacterized protein n=1 Tax=Lipomyces doorenjongii TaxID=383834 RepID=UPI0034CE83D0